MTHLPSVWAAKKIPKNLVAQMTEDLCKEALHALGAFDYVAATKITTRILRIYQPLGNILLKLCNCESLYTQLSFMKQKWFMRNKDTVLSYTYLADDIAREVSVLEMQPSATGPLEAPPLLSLMNVLIDACRVRQTLINVYQSIGNQTASTESILDELHIIQTTCEQMHLSNRAGLFGLSLTTEISILQSLLQARKCIIDYQFQDACIALFMCKQHLNNLKNACQEQDFSDKSSIQTQDVKETPAWLSMFFGSSSDKNNQGQPWPHTLRWQAKYLENLTAKMTLYFSNILLAKESILNEEDPEKALWKGLKIDYHDQIATFRKRSGAQSVGIIYEVTPSVPFHPQGYVCSGTPYEPPQGIHSFPYIYSQPSQPPKSHLPNIISIIQGSHNKLTNAKKLVHFFDSKIGNTYYIARIDEHGLLVIIYGERHVQSDMATIDFVNSLITSLRGSSVIGDLMRME